MGILETTGWIVAQVFMVVLALLYLVFAGVMVKQVGVMTSTITLNAGKAIKILVWIHLVFALLVVIASIVIL